MLKKRTVYKYPLLPEEKRILTCSKVQLPVRDERDGSCEEHGSISQVSMYLRCAKQYEFRYVLGEKVPPAAAIIEGTSHHAANEINNRHKIKTGKDLSVKKQQEAFADTFSDKKGEIKAWEGENADIIIKRGKALQEDYITRIAPTLLPELVEDKIEMWLGPVRMIGFIDVSGKMEIVNPAGIKKRKFKMQDVTLDYKVTSRAKKQDVLETDLQLSMYGWQNAEKHGGLKSFSGQQVGFCLFLKSSNPSVQTQLIPFDVRRVFWLRKCILSAVNGISLGSFPVCDSSINYLCSPKFCGYWKKCKGKVFKG